MATRNEVGVPGYIDTTGPSFGRGAHGYVSMALEYSHHEGERTLLALGLEETPFWGVSRRQYSARKILDKTITKAAPKCRVLQGGTQKMTRGLMWERWHYALQQTILHRLIAIV